MTRWTEQDRHLSPSTGAWCQRSTYEQSGLIFHSALLPSFVISLSPSLLYPLCLVALGSSGRFPTVLSNAPWSPFRFVLCLCTVNTLNELLLSSFIAEVNHMWCGCFFFLGGVGWTGFGCKRGGCFYKLFSFKWAEGHSLEDEWKLETPKEDWSGWSLEERMEIVRQQELLSVLICVKESAEREL